MVHQISNQSIKILYGDDDSDMQMLIKIMLQRAGMEVVVAGNGQEVLNLWQQDNFYLQCLWNGRLNDDS